MNQSIFRIAALDIWECCNKLLEMKQLKIENAAIIVRG